MWRELPAICIRCIFDVWNDVFLIMDLKSRVHWIQWVVSLCPAHFNNTKKLHRQTCGPPNHTHQRVYTYKHKLGWTKGLQSSFFVKSLVMRMRGFIELEGCANCWYAVKCHQLTIIIIFTEVIGVVSWMGVTKRSCFYCFATFHHIDMQ